VPFLAQQGGILLLNPGSPSDKRRQRRFTWATLELRDGRATAAIHAYDDRG
jgi:predicted phosphodiesterase